MRDHIRILIRETIELESEFDNVHLLYFWNTCMRMRAMQLGLQGEGYTTDFVTTALVANQSKYSCPEGYGRVRKVTLVRTDGGYVSKLDLDRDEKYGQDIVVTTQAIVGVNGYRPTYRFVGELICIEPAPTTSVAGGLEIEIDNSPLLFTADGDKLDTRFPIELENLLEMDVAEMCFAVEDSQGNAQAIDEGAMHRFQKLRGFYQTVFDEYTANRAQSRVFGQPADYGD